MPVRIRDGTQGVQTPVTPFVGPIDHTQPVEIDPSDFFGSDWLDARGYLKQGTPLQADGTPVSDVDQVVAGCLVEATQIVFPEGAAITQTMLDAEADRPVIITPVCQLNQDVLEDSLGRALNANELAAIAASKAVFLI